MSLTGKRKRGKENDWETADTVKAIIMLKIRDRRNTSTTPAEIDASAERLRSWRNKTKEMQAKCRAAKGCSINQRLIYLGTPPNSS